MKYDKETTDLLTTLYTSGATIKAIALKLDVSDRSVIAKLSSLGLYKKQPYLNKNGQTPIKKEEYITNIAKLLGVEQEQLESLEKVNKSVLSMLQDALDVEIDEISSEKSN